MAENPSDLVGKEFIFEYGVDRILPPSDKTGGVFATEQRAYRRERIVRCRDCEHAYEIDGTDELSCLYFNQWDYSNDCPGEWRVEPDGFCAWGEERGDDRD